MLLTYPELLLISGIIFLIGLDSYLAIKSRSWVQIYRPTLFVAVVLAFYVLVGPLRAILATGEVPNFAQTSGTIYRGLEHRPYLIWGWLGALSFYGSLLIGFYLIPSRMSPKRLMINVHPASIRRWGQLMCFIGLLLYALVNGGRLINLLNPFTPYGLADNFLGISGLDVGAFENYFRLAINLLIPGILIQFAIWLRQRKYLWTIVLWMTIAILIFLSETFRYRILLLVVPMVLLWLFYNKRRPRIISIILFMVVFIGLNGVVGLSRTHWRGLDLARVTNYTPSQIFTSSFEEASVFLTTSAVFNVVPSQIPFSGLEPFRTVLYQPIPRSIFPSKPSGKYSNNVRKLIYGTNRSFTAYLNYAEYYLIYGWPSLIGASMFLGWLLRRLWNWFLFRQYEPLAQAIYLSNACYLYVVVSRGYLPQVIMLYFFSILPAFCVYWIVSKRI